MAKKSPSKGGFVSHVLTLDSELAEYVDIAADMMERATAARARRMDPDGQISTSAGMANAKLKTLRAQIAAGPLRKWDQLNEVEKERVRQACIALIGPRNEDEERAAWLALRAFILTRHDFAELPFDPLDAEQSRL